LLQAIIQLETETRGITQVLGQTLFLIVVLAAPFVLFGVVMHAIERKIQGRLASRFGWRSVLWTGWLGTPIHELSHAVMCVVFQHKIKDIALFEPDLKTGRLGYVEHSFHAGNWFQEAGNFFIGMAPLIGGSVALAAVLWMFFPEPAAQMFQAGQSPDGSLISHLVDATGGLLQQLAAPANWVSWKFWLFIYLVLCIGGHMAPSRSDYDGASRGVLLVVGLALLILFLFSLAGVRTDQMMGGMIRLLTPVFGLQILSILVCCFATAIVYGITAIFPGR